jgi:hypothetical protein
VRLAATGRYLAVLVGPGVGSVIMLTLGTTHGIFLNTLFYLPLVLWLVGAPYGRHFRGDRPPPKRAVRGLADIIQTAREVRAIPVLGAMIVLAARDHIGGGDEALRQARAACGGVGIALSCLAGRLDSGLGRRHLFWRAWLGYRS